VRRQLGAALTWVVCSFQPISQELFALKTLTTAQAAITFTCAPGTMETSPVPLTASGRLHAAEMEPSEATEPDSCVETGVGTHAGAACPPAL
jgi:hypothetical protein